MRVVVFDKLGEMLKVPTISYEDSSLIDYDVFHKYIELVQKLYPKVFEKCEYELTKELVIKLKLKGESSERPTVLMSHYDVVPVTEGWDHNPFLGEVVDGYLYGRGALDTKCTMACALSALKTIYIYALEETKKFMAMANGKWLNGLKKKE